MDKQKNDGKLIVSVLMVCFAVTIGVMIFALCRPNDKKSAEFTPPPFESTAQHGKPEVSENLGYSSPNRDDMSYDFAVCGNVTMEGDKAIVYLTNIEGNNAWIKLRVFDEQGNMLGETGLIKPNEYVKYVTLPKTPEVGTKIKLKIMGYEPHTYYSAGAASLNGSNRPMKKMTSFLALVLALSIPSGAYAAEAKLDDNNTTANGNVYAVYTEDVPWNSVPVDDDGNAVIDFPDGTSVRIENADKGKNLVVDQITEKEALDWLNSVMGKKSENTVAFHIYYIDGDSILPANGIKVTINTDKDQVNSVKADGTVSSLKCEESDAEISFVTDDAPFYVLGTKTPESSSDISPDSTGKKDDSLQNSSQTAVQNVNKDGDKSPNTGLGAGAALTMLLLGAVAISVSKRTKDK